MAVDWILIGRALKIDSITPFIIPDGIVVQVFKEGVSGSLGSSGITDSNGSFSITLNKQQFQSPPSLVIKVLDSQNRILYTSATFTPSFNEDIYNIGSLTVDRMPIPPAWNIHGIVFQQDRQTPFNNGIINVYGLNDQWLGETGINSDGSFTLTFARDTFQNGNVNIEAPEVIIKIRNNSYQILWQSNPFVVPSSEYYINPVIGTNGEIVPDIPVIPDNWSVFGNVLEEGGNIPSLQITIKVFDVLYGVYSLLGETVLGTNGTYTINYNKSAFQKGDTGRTKPNLIVKVYSADGSLIDKSGQYDNALVNQEIENIIIPPAPIIITPPVDNWSVSGVVRDEKGYLVTLGTVYAYDVRNGLEKELGNVSLNKSGQYYISFTSAEFKSGNNSITAPNIQVRLFYPNNVLLVESAVVENASSELIIDLILPSSSPVEGSEYCVYGLVSNRANLPVAHHKVDAFLLRILDGEFSEIELGTAFTDVKGNYEIYYDPSLLEFPLLFDPTGHGAETDSIFIRLPKSSEDKNTTYDISSVVCHSAKRQKIDIQVDRASGSDDSEYEEIYVALSPYIAALQATYSQAEPAFSNRIQYIFCKTGVDDFKVLAFYHSLHIAKRIIDILPDFELNTDCDFEKFMYASFRLGCPSDVDSFFATEASYYYNILTEAIKTRVIAETCTANLSCFWEQWLKLVQALGSNVDIQKSEPTVSVFAATILNVLRGPKPRTEDAGYNSWIEQKEQDDEIVRNVIRIHQEVQGDMEAFWKEMRAEVGTIFTDVFVTQLTFIFDLYSISDGFVPFAQGVFHYFVANKVNSYEFPIDAYNIRNLASINEGMWIGMTSYFLNYTENKFPGELLGSTDNEKLHILAAKTRKLYKKKFPIENISEQYAIFENEELELKPIGEFLKNAKDFDLDSTNIDDYLAAHPEVTADIENFNEENIKTLKAVQRINRLTEDFEAQSYLLLNGFDSSYKISLVEEERFVADHAEGLGGIDEARQIHRLAVMYSTDTLSTLGKFHNSLNFEGSTMTSVNRGLSSVAKLSGIAATPLAGNSSTPVLEPTPTYETLFGTLSQAQFENSQTVFSASAYFVELLEFIEGVSRKNIFSRRPELQEIELTQKNAETVLPYIDIVLEILENAISPRQFFLQETYAQDEGDISIKDFLALASIEGGVYPNKIPYVLVEKLELRGIEIVKPFELRIKLKDNEWYLLTESWRILISTRIISEMNISGYLITPYPQTSKDSADLSVMPEHHNPLVYEALSKLYFPLQLPLNPGAEEVKETLSLLGVSKLNSILALRKKRSSRYTDTDGELICANFGVTKDMLYILEWNEDAEKNPVLTTPWELWGLLETGNQIAQAEHPDKLVPGSTWVQIMSFVPEFLRRTGLNIDEMMSLFAMKVLNPEGLIMPDTAKKEGLQTGDPDYYNISGFDGEGTALNKIYCLIRLKAILQCSWNELDSFLIAAYKGMPSSLNILNVAKIFKERYSISWADIGCFWNTEDTAKAELLLIKTLKLNKEDFDELKKFSGINPFDEESPENLLLFDDEVKRVLDSGIKLKDLWKLLRNPAPEENDAKWVQDLFIKLREIAAETETFLSSDEVPGTEDEIPEAADKLNNFKENYYNNKVIPSIKTLLSETFAEFTGGDVELSSNLLLKNKENSLFDLWYKLSKVGWKRTIGIDAIATYEKDFLLPEKLSEDFNAETLVTWSAVFLAPRSGDLKFQLYKEGCSVKVKINEEYCEIAEDDDSFSVANIDEGKAVRIDIEVDDIENPLDFNMELFWNASEVKNPDGSISSITEKIPVIALIPSDSYVDYDELQSALPAFRKLSEYLEVTGMSANLFKILSKKSTENTEWKILLPEQLPVQQSEYLNIWHDFICLIDILKLNTYFPIDESKYESEAKKPDLPFFRMIEDIENLEAEDRAAALESLCEMQNGWDKVRLEELVKHLIPAIDSTEEITSPDVIASPKTLLLVLENMPTLQKVGVSIAVLKGVLNDAPIDADVKKFRYALQDRLGMESWKQMVTAMMNALRIRKRDALVAFLTYPGPDLERSLEQYYPSYISYLRALLSNAGVLQFEEKFTQSALKEYALLTGMPDASVGNYGDWSLPSKNWVYLDGRKGYRDANDIYSHFLIDVEMNTDMITSRIVQASAAIQLFVQRTLLGMEKSSYLNEQDIEQWTWLKNYRLWESNRKIFLYPENWIEPELRDDKTQFFKELEAEFEGGEITSEIAKNALGNYLDKMRTVSGLDIIGVYRGNAEIPRAKDTLHIIGKTKSNPYQYFYRRCHRKNNLPSVWTPWEVIDVDIQADSVLPVFFNGYLHVFWVTYKPVKHSGEDKTLVHIDGEQNRIELPVPKDRTVVELSFCWSVLANGKWANKKQGSSLVDVYNDFIQDDSNWNAADHYHFIVKGNTAEYLQINIYRTNAESTLMFNLGIYTLWHDGLDSLEKVDDTIGWACIKEPQGSTLLQNYTKSYESDSIIFSNGTPLLGRTSCGYKIITANSGFTSGIEEPGFLADASGTYFIQKSDDISSNNTYKMEPFYHPNVKELQKRFSEGGLYSLMRRETQALSTAEGYGYYRSSYSYYSYNYYYNIMLGYYIAGDWQAWDAGQNAFELRYLPSNSKFSKPYPMDVVDFNYGSSNGIYNWELFFHAPFLIARLLSASQRYEEALDWYHFIFDPRNKLNGYEKTKRWAKNLPSGARFWNFLPFFANPDADKTIENQIGLPDSRGKMPDVQAMKSLIDDWKNDPFNPHLIARSRIVAYQKAVVMHYLDTLVAWADRNFRTDTLESINEAIQLYILAAEILGTRPKSMPSTLKISSLSYTEMKKKNMDSFSNVVVKLENSLVKVEAGEKKTNQGAVASPSKQVLKLGPKMFFFTVPNNDKVLSYWDLLDDRLFKIRNGMNIDGVKRQLSLFAPPIDPGLLVRAAAAGIDIGAALNDMFAPVPQYRFTFMVQKAIELCNIVQSMGGAILSALEKKDAEELSRLRAEHEGVLLKLSTEIKEMQIDEAGISIEGLKKSKASIEFRKKHYEELIAAGDSELEKQQLKQMEEAAEYSEKANNHRLAITATASVPDFIAGASGFGGSPHVTTAVSVREMTRAVSGVKAAEYDLKAANRQNSASRAGIRSGYERRLKDWEFQKESAEKELENIEQQILGAEIRLQVAKTELANLEKQIAQSEEVYEYLKNKYTNTELYHWMITEISSLYNKNYQLAYDVAKRAEKSYGFELGVTDSSFIQPTYWDGLRKGLLSGERLMLDIRRMEISYIDMNKRELEITKPVSIAQLDPEAILDLQEKGVCTFSLPEALFDMDFPGHYFRRIKSVRLTIPCVAGPYTSVSAKLNLTKNSMRKTSQVNPTSGDSYPRNPNEDARFVDQRIGIQGIATSQPNGATGMFDFNFKDERYLPFEGAGVISSWSLELPTELRQFDYRTITDVVLNISYTAREDGSLKNAANLWIKTAIANYVKALSRDEASANRLLSLKHEFPDAYKSLLASGSASFSITAEHFPYFLKDKGLKFIDTTEEDTKDSIGSVIALAKGNVKLNKAVKVKFKEIEKEEVTIYQDSLVSGGSESKIYSGSFPKTSTESTPSSPISWKDKSVIGDYTIEASFNASEVDDILINLNYTIGLK